MSFLPAVPTDLQGKPKDYLVELVRQLEKELRHRIRQQSDGKTYFGYEAPYVYVDVNGVQYELGTDVLPPGLGTSDLQANGGTIPETDRDNTFSGNVVINGTAQKALVVQGASGGNTVLEIGLLGEASLTGIDFHSGAIETDYDFRMIANGGDGTSGGGEMLFQGQTKVDRPVGLSGEGWNAPTLQNGWVNYGGAYATAGFRKTAAGMVVVKGLIKNGTTTAGTVLLTLPVGYRPAEQLIITTTSNNAWARIDVKTDGTVTVNAGVSTNWVAINFSFYADQ